MLAPKGILSLFPTKTVLYTDDPVNLAEAEQYGSQLEHIFLDCLSLEYYRHELVIFSPSVSIQIEFDKEIKFTKSIAS